MTTLSKEHEALVTGSVRRSTNSVGLEEACVRTGVSGSVIEFAMYCRDRGISVDEGLVDLDAFYAESVALSLGSAIA